MSTKLRLEQIRMEALSAIFLHQRRLKSIRLKVLLLDFLTISVPIAYFIPRYFFKSSEYSFFIELSWEILATFLLILGVLKVVFQWTQKQERHSFMIYKNRETSNEALDLMKQLNLPEMVLNQFFKRTEENDRYDNDDLLLNTKLSEDQLAYRYALKHLFYGKTTYCPKCKADPWIFTKGSCQLCGNTPK